MLRFFDRSDYRARSDLLRATTCQGLHYDNLKKTHVPVRFCRKQCFFNARHWPAEMNSTSIHSAIAPGHDKGWQRDLSDQCFLTQSNIFAPSPIPVLQYQVLGALDWLGGRREQKHEPYLGPRGAGLRSIDRLMRRTVTGTQQHKHSKDATSRRELRTSGTLR